jgi:hypothetical protein
MYDDDDDDYVDCELSAIWEICDECQGNGKSSRYLEHDGGGWTMSEFCEDFPDQEDQEDYFAGRYDRTCAACNGSGKVLVVDEDQLDEKTLNAYRASRRAEEAYRREEAYTRRMGM